jgi:3-mercaptopyruvate sulfurtransferase SseA
LGVFLATVGRFRFFILLAPENLSQEGAQRGGHIPGAANIPWSQAVQENGTFRPAEELRALYEGRGITPEKERSSPTAGLASAHRTPGSS